MARLRLRPTVITDLHACLPAAPLARQILDKMRELCWELGTPVEQECGQAVMQVEELQDRLDAG